MLRYGAVKKLWPELPMMRVFLMTRFPVRSLLA